MKSKICILLLLLLCGCSSSPSNKSNVLTSLPTYTVSELSLGADTSAVFSSGVTYALSGDGKTIAVIPVLGNGGVWVSQLKNNIWGPFTQVPGSPVTQPEELPFIVISADGKTVAISGNFENSVWIAQQDSSGAWGSFTQTLTGNSDVITWMSMSDDGSKTAVVLGDKSTLIPVGVGMVTMTNGISNWTTLSNVGFDQVKISGDGNTLLLLSSYQEGWIFPSLWTSDIRDNQFVPVQVIDASLGFLGDQLSLLINQNGSTISALMSNIEMKNGLLWVSGDSKNPNVSLPNVYAPNISLSSDGNTMVLVGGVSYADISVWMAQKNNSGWSEFSRLPLMPLPFSWINGRSNINSQWMSQDASTIILSFDVQNNKLVLASTKTFSTSQCSAGQTNCNGVCVTTSSDPNNCGSCGNVCGNYCANYSGGWGCSSYQQESCAQGTCQGGF